MKKILTGKLFCYGLFWSWNFLFIILFTALEIEAGFAWHILQAGLTGRAHWDFVITALIIYLIPFVCVLLAIVWMRKKHVALAKLFYGAEVPLTIICMLRLSLIREMNPGTAYLFILLIIGMSTYLYIVVIGKRFQNKWFPYLYMFLHTILLIIGVYIICILSFYIPPLGAFFVENIILDFDWVKVLFSSFLVLIGIVFGIWSFTLFLGLPFALIVLYLRAFTNEFILFKERFGRITAYIFSGGLILINIFLFYFLSNYQPHEYSLSFGKKPITKETITEFYNNESDIRTGLLNAYLSPYRYLSETSHNNHMSELYRDAFGGEREGYRFVQDLHNGLLKPFLYSGESMSLDQDSAEKLYEQYFDEPIQKAEKKAIRNAINATWDRDDAEAGVLNIDEEKVLITEQKIIVSEHGDVADIELYECYQNQTFDRLEIMYYFSLPENAVITGLWLSDDSMPKKYSFNVSPKGAAQQVYKDEVRRRVDPSLLEQTGPGLYRLRAFPIPPKTTDYQYDSTGRGRPKVTVKDAEKFHLWLSCQVMIDSSGQWPLPELMEKRNVYCNGNTVCMLNGAVIEKDNDSDWLPSSLKPQGEVKPLQHISLLDDSIAIKAVPFTMQENLSALNISCAVVVDRSYSMNRLRDKVRENFNTLARISGKTDLYMTGVAPVRIDDDIKNFDFNKTANFGNTQQLQSLYQFDSLRNGRRYDAVLFLTDKGSYELSDDSLEAISFDFPVYIIHLDSKPFSYHDALLTTIIKSNGKTCHSINEALKDIQFRNMNKGRNDVLDYSGGYLWSREPVSSTQQAVIQPISAGKWIDYKYRSAKGEQLSDLDALHHIAIEHKLVSFLSSMIVLVNEEQKKALEEAEQKADRFNRETETGKEILCKPSSIGNVSGTPEPEEWLLIGLVLLMLLYANRKNLIRQLANLTI